MISNRKYKQYIKLKFDIETPIGGVLSEGNDDEILSQRLYGKAFQTAGIGLTESWANKPKANEVRDTVLVESWSVRTYDPTTAEERYHTLDTRYELSEKAEKILEDLGFEVSIVDTSKELDRPQGNAWIPTKLFIDGKIGRAHV